MNDNYEPRELVFTRQTGPGELTKVIIEYLRFGEVHIGEEFREQGNGSDRPAEENWFTYTKTAMDEGILYAKAGHELFIKTFEPDDNVIVITKEIVR